MSDICTPEPEPTQSDESQPVEPYLIQLIRDRTAEGERRYGTVLKTYNGRDALMDAMQESIDLNQYLCQRLMEDRAALAALQAENAGLVGSLERLRDSAYVTYVRRTQRSECLGWESKVKQGVFGAAELTGHKVAAEWLGRHKAYSDILSLLKPSPTTTEGGGDGMIGGEIIHIDRGEYLRVEVLDPTHFDRQWRLVEPDADVEVGDHLWWQSFKGFLTRSGEFEDKKIGQCKPAAAPTPQQGQPHD